MLSTAGMIVIGAEVLIIIIALIAYWTWKSKTIEVERSASTAERSAVTETPEPAASPTVVAAISTPSASGPISTPAVTRLQIKIQVLHNKKCWIRFIPDADQFKDRTLGPGGSLEIAAKDKIRLSVGDATAVSVTINGRSAKLPVKGNRVSITDLLITKENYQQFLQ
jgi:hypothetical protein